MPSLDPCAEGCADNITSERPPGAADDPCNNSGEGYFCEGSIWTYDPTLPGADTATNGDCARSWIRIGGNCNVAEWLELATAGILSDTGDPVDGVDCCPPGTLWHNTVNSTYFVSTNDGGDCTWCQICIPHNLTATALPTGTDCGEAGGGYAVGSIWRIPAGTLLPTQVVDIVYHLINDNPCQWCRICGGDGIALSNNLVFEAIPEAVTFVPTIASVTFDIFGEYNLGAQAATILLPGKYVAHVAAQVRMAAPAAQVILEFGVRINGVITFWPISQSYLNMLAGQSLNISGVSHTVYAAPGDVVDFVVRVIGSGGNATLESLVVNWADYIQ